MPEFKTQKKPGSDLLRVSIFYHALKGVHTKCGKKKKTITNLRARFDNAGKN